MTSQYEKTWKYSGAEWSPASRTEISLSWQQLFFEQLSSPQFSTGVFIAQFTNSPQQKCKLSWRWLVKIKYNNGMRIRGTMYSTKVLGRIKLTFLIWAIVEFLFGLDTLTRRNSYWQASYNLIFRMRPDWWRILLNWNLFFVENWHRPNSIRCW